MNNLTLYLKEPEKEQTQSKLRRRKKMTQITTEISEVEMRKIIEKINKTKSWSSKKINKID